MEPTEQQIRNQLALIDRSQTFSRSLRMREFLRFLVLRALSSPGVRISAYVIGREVFRRSESFDPNEDPLVRVEAVRLRKLLNRYYAEHSTDQVLISIPKGQYAPRFSITESAHEPLSQDYNAIGLLALPIEAPNAHRDLALGVSSEVLTQLSRVGELRIVNGNGLQHQEPSALYEQARLEFACDYILQGQVLDAGTLLRLCVQLTNASSRHLLWSDQYDITRDAAKLYDAVNDISAQVVRKVATPAGALFPDQLFKRLNKPPASWDAVDCVLRWHAYRLRFRTKPFYRELKNAVSTVQAKDPVWHMGHAIQSYLELEAWIYRMDTTVSQEQALREAMRHAKLALSGDQNNPMGHYMLALVAYFSEDIAQCAEHVSDALQRCPGHTDIMHHAGTLLAWGGRVAEGESLILKADLEYQTAIAYRQFYITRAYREREYREMQSLLATADYGDGWYLAPLLNALCAHNLGDSDAAAAYLQDSFAIEPTLVNDLEAEIAKWIKDPELQARMLRDLHQAGYEPHAQSINQ